MGKLSTWQVICLFGAGVLWGCQLITAAEVKALRERIDQHAARIEHLMQLKKNRGEP